MAEKSRSRSRKGRVSARAMFSKDEVRDIVIAVAALTLIFAYDASYPPQTFINLPLAFAAVVLVFLAHELAHRFAANKFGAAARYRIWIGGLVFGLILMFTGIKFAVPGAVVIYPFTFGRWGFRKRQLDLTEEGLISTAGVATNIMISAVFTTIPGTFFQYIASVSAWIALFNLIPLKPLDGHRIFGWKPHYWLFLMIIAILLFFV